MTNYICICMPADLRDRAKDLRVNISAVCRRALAEEVSTIEHQLSTVKPETTAASQVVRDV